MMVISGDYHKHHTENVHIHLGVDDPIPATLSGISDVLQLAPLVRLLVGSLHPEKIYRVPHKDPVSGQVHAIDLLVIVAHNNDRAAPELFLETSPFRDLPVRCIIHPEAHFLQKLEQSPAYYILHCTAENLLYDNRMQQYPLADPAQIQRMRKQAYQLFFKRLSIASDFLSCAQAFLEEPENIKLTGFFIHQSVETVYRFFTGFLDGYEKKTHCIRSLQKRVGWCAPQLREHFAERTAEDKRLLDLLEDCYNRCRYDDSFDACREDLDILYQRAEKLTETAPKIMESLLGLPGTGLSGS